MDKAKASVKDFLSKSGHHDTTVHEQVAPAVQQETVVPEQREEVTPVRQKEVHQNHEHTSVQPVRDSEVLPEQHHHNLVGVEKRHHDHDDRDKINRSLESERAQFQNTSERVEGKQTTSTAAMVEGETVHHHVHETIQPVVQKQTIEPHVVHTTVPIHEVHNNETKHHAASSLPAMSMEDFKKQGGTLRGDKERHDQFEGCPPDRVGGHGGTSTSGTSAAPLTSTTSTSRDAGLNGASSGVSGINSNTSSNNHTSSTITGSDPVHHSDGPFNSHKHDPKR